MTPNGGALEQHIYDWNLSAASVGRRQRTSITKTAKVQPAREDMTTRTW